MKCEDVQKKILIEDLKDLDIQNHIAGCDACQEFQKDFGVIMADHEKIEVPKSLDEKILTFAKENRPEVKPANKPIIPFVFMAIAAIIAILLSVNILNTESEKIKNSPGFVDNQEVDEDQKVVNPVAPKKAKEMVAEVPEESQNIDDVLNNLWSDDSIDADLIAVESELFVLSAELYTN